MQNAETSQTFSKDFHVPQKIFILEFFITKISQLYNN